MFTHGSASLTRFPVVSIFQRYLGVICYDRWILSEGHKNYFRCCLPWTHSLPFYFWPILTQWIMVILSKGCKPDNLESYNSLKLSFMNIWDLCSSFIDCESFLESNSPDILALCKANLDDSIDSGNVSVKGYLPLIWKNSTNILGLAVYVKEGLPFARDLSLENCTDSFLLMIATGFTSLSVLLLLRLSITLVIMHCFLFYFI